MRITQVFIFGFTQTLTFGALLIMYSHLEYQSTQILQTNGKVEHQQATISVLKNTIETLVDGNAKLNQQLSDLSERTYKLLLAQIGERDTSSETFGFCSQYIATDEDAEPQISIFDVNKPVQNPVNSTCYHITDIKSNMFDICMYPPDQDLISNYIFHDGMWESTKSILLSLFFKEQLSLPNPRKIMLDLGANQGYFGFAAASFGYKVIMVEPGDSNVDLLRQSVIKNNFQDRVTIVQNAIGNVRQPVRFFFGVGNSGASYVVPGEGESDGISHSILADDLPRILGFKTSDIFFVKTDLEGYDYHAFDGMKRLLTEGRPPLLGLELSQTTECNPQKLFQKLYDLGYIFIEEETPNVPRSFDELVNYPNLLEALFVHKDAWSLAERMRVSKHGFPFVYEN